MTSVIDNGRLRLHQRAKNHVMPQGPGLRRLPFGIGRGLRLELDFRHHTRLYLGLYEIELNRYLRSFCRPGFSCFDVGGQLGYDALVLARLCQGAVASFECSRNNCDGMKRTFDANPSISRNLRVIHARVGAESDDRLGVLALDDFAFGIGGFVPDFIKIDIEGDEVAALKGASQILVQRRPHLIVETHGPRLETECFAELRRYDYEPKIVQARRWVRDNRPAEHNRWLVARGAEC